MLPRDNRLKKNRDFRQTFKKGKVTAGKYIVLYWLPNNRDTNRYGFSVSKKVGNAVIRNRVKRILRAIINCETKIKEGFDIIVIARPKIKGISTALVEKDFKTVLSRSRLYYN